MLFTTYGQFDAFCNFIWLGFACGIIFGFLPKFKNKILNIIVDFVFVALVSFAFFYFAVMFNFGIIRLFLIIGWAVGFIIEQFFLQKTIVFLREMLYTKTSKSLKALQKAIITRVGKNNDRKKTENDS